MELELGLKVTRTREDVSSSVDFRFSKDPFGPLVLSQETNSRFIVIIHLKGFRKEGIEIEINEEGNRITIRGRKPVEEMVLIRWMAWRKEVEFRVFRKVFRIPDFVDLDKIKARFDDDDATLTITMPKRVKGISGFNIEEEEEEEGRMESGQVGAESIEREETDKQHSETEIQREEETEDDNLDDEQDTNLECIQEKDLADSNKDVGDSSLRNRPDMKGRDSHEQTRHEEQELMVEQQAETKHDDDFIRSRAYEKTEEQEPDDDDIDGDGFSKVQGIEEPERHSEESKIQDLVAGEKSGHEEKISDAKEEFDGNMGQGFTPNTDTTQVVGGDDIAEPEIKAEASEFEKPEADEVDKDTTHVVGEDGTAETKKKAVAFESDKLEAYEVDKIHELVEKKKEEGENGKMTRQSEDRNSKKSQENEEQHSKGQKRQDKKEEFKELVEEKTPKEEANIGNFFPKPVQETEVLTVDTLAKTGDEGKEVKEEKKSVDASEEVDAEMGEVFAPNTDTEAEKFESDKLKADEEDKIHKLVEKKEKKEKEEENTKFETQSEDISLVKLQEIEKQQLQEQIRNDKQEKIKESVKEKTPQAEANKGNDIPKSVQEIEVPNVDTLEKISDQGKEKNKIVKMETENKDAKEEVDAKMGEGFKPNIAENETKAEELKSDKIQKLVEKKEEEEENAKVGTKSEDISLRKLQEIGEQQLEEQKLHKKQEQIKEMAKEQTPEAETSIRNDISNPDQEIGVSELDTLEKRGDKGKEGNEKKQTVKMELKNGDAKENIDAKMGEGFTPNIGETETNAEEFGSDKVKAYEVDKIQKLVEQKEKEEENATVGTQSEEISLSSSKLQEIGEQQFEGQMRHDKQENIKDVVREPEAYAETSRGNDIPKPVQEKTKNQPEEYKEKIMETGTKINDAGTRKAQAIIRQQELDEPARYEKESKTLESVNSKTNDEDQKEKEIAEMETEEQESYRPKILGEQEKIQELVDEKTNLSKNGKFKEEERISEKKTDFGGDDNVSRKVRDVKQRDSDAMKGKEEKDMIQKLLLEEKLNDSDKGIIRHKKAENDKSKKIREIVEQQPHEEVTFGKQFQKLIAGEINGRGRGEVGDVEKEKIAIEEEKIIKDRSREDRAIENKDADLSGNFFKGTTIQDLEENKGINPDEHEEEKRDEYDRPGKIKGTIEQDLDHLNSQLEQDNVEDGKKTQELVEKKIKDGKGGEESKTKTDDDVVREVQGIKEHDLYEPKKEHVRKIKEMIEENTHDHHGKEGVKKIAESEKEVECVSLQKVDSSEEQELHEPKIHKECYQTRKTVAKQPSGQEKEKNEKKVVESMTITENENSTNVQEIKDEQPDKLESHDKQYKIREVVEAGHNDCKEDKVTAKVELETEDESSKKVPEIERKEYEGLKRSMVQDKMQETEEPDKTGAMKKEIWKRRTKTKDGGSLRKIQDDEDLKLNKPYHRQKEEKTKKVVEMGTSDYSEKVKKQDEDDILRSQEASRPELDEFERHGEQRNIPELLEEEKIKNIDEPMGRRKQTKDGSLRKVREGEDPELCKPYQRQKADKIQEVVEMETRDYREKVKKQDKDDVLRRQEAGRPFLGEQSNSPQLVEEEEVENIAEQGRKIEDDSSSKFHEFEEGKSYEDWTREEPKRRKDLAKEEATDIEDKHTSGEGHNDHKEEQQEEKVNAKPELETKIDISKKVQETEKQVNDELKRSMVQDKMQETEDKDNIRAMEQIEILERRKKTNDDRLKEVQESKDPELDRHEKEDTIQELEETEKNDHRGKVKKKDKDDILRSQETGKMVLGELESHGKQRKIHQSVEDEKEEKKIENISEPGEKWKGHSSGKFHEFQKQKSFEDWRQEESEEIENFVEEEATGLKDKHTGAGEHEEERYEKFAQTNTKVENEMNKEEQYGELDKLEGVLRDGASDLEMEEENLVDDFTTKIQETKKEESLELEMHEKLDIVPDFVKSKTGDQEDEKAKESAVVVASNENESSRKIQKIEEEEPVRQKEQNKIPETIDPEVKEEDEEIVSEKERKEEFPKSRNVRERKELEAHVQGKTKSPERFEKKIDDCIVRKNRETKVQETNEKNDRERKGNTGEQERKESSNHEVNVVKDDSLRKGQEFLENESDLSKRRPVKQEKIQELMQDRVNDDEEISEAETKINDGKSRNFDICKLMELDESKDNEEHKTTQKSLEENSNAPEIEKEGNEKISEEKMQDKIDCRIKDQEFKEEEQFEHDKIPKYHKEDEKVMEQRKIEEMKRRNENASSRKVQKIKSDGLENQRKLSEIQENSNIHELVEEEEMSEGGGHEAVLKIKSQDVEEKGSDQPKRYAEEEKSQELKNEDRKKEYHIRDGEQNEKAKRVPQVESKSSDDKTEKSETEDNESTKLRGQKKKENHHEVVQIETSNQMKGKKDEEFTGKAKTIHEYYGSMKTHEHEERKSNQMSKKLTEEKTSDDKDKERNIADTSGKLKDNTNQETKRRDDSSGNKTQENEKQECHEQKRNEEDVVGKTETIAEYDRSRKIHEHDERKLDRISKKYAEEDTSNDKEAKGNKADAVLGEVETKTGKVREHEEQEHDKKQSLEKDASGIARDNENQEKRRKDDSSGNTQRHENQESLERKGNEEQDKKNLRLVGTKSRNEEDGKEDKEFKEAEVLRKLKGIEKQESTKMVERDENQDSINELVDEKTKNHGGEDKKSMTTKAEKLELKRPEGENKQDKSSKCLRDNHKDTEPGITETQSKDNEPKKIHQIKEEKETSEQERLKEQGKIKELVEVRTQYYREIENRETECGDGSSKEIQEKDKEKSIEPGRDEKQDKIQEPVDRETSEDEEEEEEEELEVEFEDEEEDWEAEVIQEMDSDEDNDKFRQIKRIRLGFRLLGGSTLFMSLIVIVIPFIRSKRKIICYKL